MNTIHKHTPYIITDNKASNAEQDCACADENIGQYFLLGLDSLADPEGDCACSIPLPASTDQVSTALRWQQPQSLRRIPLPDAHELLFNPLGSRGPVVLNEAARQVFDVFQQAQNLKDIPHQAPHIQPSQSARAARLLAEYGFLTPETCPQIAPAPGKSTTLTAWLHVTNACNLSCDYCYLAKTAEVMKPAIGRKAVQAVFRSALANGFKKVKIKYSGGEALLNFSLILALHGFAQKLAQENNLEQDAVILTNGVLLSQSIISQIRNAGLRLSISLDGIGAENDVQRHFRDGRGSFAAIARNLELLEANQLKPSITVTVAGRNLAGLPRTIEFLLQGGLPFTINFYRENACAGSQPGLSYQDEQMIAGMKAAFAVIEKNLPPFSLLGALTDRARLDVNHQRPCGVGQSYLVIDQNGSVSKCHMEIQQRITDIFDEDPLRTLRNDLRGLQNCSVEEKEVCRECSWRYWCAGGCPALTHRVAGRYDVKSPNCDIYQALFPEVLRLEGLRMLKYQDRALS